MLRIFAGLIAVMGAVQESAQAQPAPPPAKVWNLEWQEDQCTISTGSPDTMALSLWMTPGNPDPEIYLIGSRDVLRTSGNIPSWSRSHRPAKRSKPTSITWAALRISESLLLTKLREKFPAAFAKANELRLLTGHNPVVIPVTGASKAMAAMQLCIDDKLSWWGVDVAAYHALRAPPTDLSDDPWIKITDFPHDALVFAKSGQVVARLNVDATGRVADCAVVVSAGWKSLDDTTCRVARQKARYHPAIGADGKPTAAIFIVNVGFRVLY